VSAVRKHVEQSANTKGWRLWTHQGVAVHAGVSEEAALEGLRELVKEGKLKELVRVFCPEEHVVWGGESKPNHPYRCLHCDASVSAEYEQEDYFEQPEFVLVEPERKKAPVDVLENVQRLLDSGHFCLMCSESLRRALAGQKPDRIVI
jgi:hypothetical protein